MGVGTKHNCVTNCIAEKKALLIRVPLYKDKTQTVAKHKFKYSRTNPTLYAQIKCTVDVSFSNNPFIYIDGYIYAKHDFKCSGNSQTLYTEHLLINYLNQ